MQLPYTHLDMGDGANLSATLTIDQTLRWTIAITMCTIMVLVTLPTTITRVAMLHLDCLVVRQTENVLVDGDSCLRKEIPKNRVGTGTKTGTAVCCGAVGLFMIAFVIVMILLIVIFGM